MNPDHPAPLMIGRYTTPAGTEFLPVSPAEVTRLREFFRQIMDTCALPPRSQILVISMFDEGAFTVGLEPALQADGLIPCYAEATSFDAGRVEAFIRRMDIRVVMGLNSETLRGLEQLGHDPVRLLADKIVFVRDEASYQLLHGKGNYRLLRWYTLGPATTIECLLGQGLHLDETEWHLSQDDQQQILFSSRLQRALDIVELASGFHARIETTPCRCGIDGPRLLPS